MTFNKFMGRFETEEEARRAAEIFIETGKRVNVRKSYSARKFYINERKLTRTDGTEYVRWTVKVKPAGTKAKHAKDLGSFATEEHAKLAARMWMEEDTMDVPNKCAPGFAAKPKAPKVKKDRKPKAPKEPKIRKTRNAIVVERTAEERARNPVVPAPILTERHQQPGESRIDWIRRLATSSTSY